MIVAAYFNLKHYLALPDNGEQLGNKYKQSESHITSTMLQQENYQLIGDLHIYV